MAINVFDETTTACLTSYFPDRFDAIEFTRLIHTWWVISNAKKRFNIHNKIGNAAILGDKKPDFFRKLADWCESWHSIRTSGCEKFTLTKQTCSALVLTLRATASLIEDFLSEGFIYVLTVRFQSDLLKGDFQLTVK